MKCFHSLSIRYDQKLASGGWVIFREKELALSIIFKAVCISYSEIEKVKVSKFVLERFKIELRNGEAVYVWKGIRREQMLQEFANRSIPIVSVKSIFDL